MYEVVSMFNLNWNNSHSFYLKATNHRLVPKSPVFPLINRYNYFKFCKSLNYLTNASGCL
jgi:hypothetical protein